MPLETTAYTIDNIPQLIEGLQQGEIGFPVYLDEVNVEDGKLVDALDIILHINHDSNLGSDTSGGSLVAYETYALLTTPTGESKLFKPTQADEEAENFDPRLQYNHINVAIEEFLGQEEGTMMYLIRERDLKNESSSVELLRRRWKLFKQAHGHSDW